MRWFNQKPAVKILWILLIFLLVFWLFSDKHQDYLVNQTTVEQNSTHVLGSSADNINNVQLVRVTRVIDGDTIELSDGQKVRYIGIDTPETSHPQKGVECFGKEASERNRQLVEGREVRLEKDVSETDRYGRLLRYVWLGDELMNETLVKEGFAYVSSYPPDISKQEIFRQAQAEAQQNQVGLWSGCELEDQSEVEGFTTKNQAAPEFLAGCVIKGNIAVSGDEKIYHLPDCESYEITQINAAKGEKWFCSETEAIEAGWRKAGNC